MIRGPGRLQSAYAAAWLLLLLQLGKYCRVVSNPLGRICRVDAQHPSARPGGSARGNIGNPCHRAAGGSPPTPLSQEVCHDGVIYPSSSPKISPILYLT